MGQSTQTMDMLTKLQAFYDESQKTALGYQNPLYLTQAQRKVPALYCGNTIVKQHDALFVIDTEETLELAEEIPTGRYVVPTGRVIATVSIKVPTGRYVVPTGRVIATVSIKVPTGSMEKSFLNEYSECVELKAELSKKNEMVEKAVYDELSK
ncbi:hypothetical protein Tco_0150258 [Tanacetum coccineum]